MKNSSIYRRNHESRKLGQDWEIHELLVVLDMHLNGRMTDSHEHDGIARCLGRFNPNTRSFFDGAVNQKLAEIKGQLDHTRVSRHPGEAIVALIGEFGDDPPALRAAAIKAWERILSEYHGQVPKYVQDLLADEGAGKTSKQEIHSQRAHFELSPTNE